MRKVTDSINVGPPPARAFSIARFASRYTARTSVPSTTIPSKPYASARSATCSVANSRCVGVEYAHWLLSQMKTIGSLRVDGANGFKTFWYVTMPQLKPIILLCAILSTNGTLQMFDESFNLTAGGPGNTTMTVSHYLYNVSFRNSPNFGYAAAISYAILIIVAILAAIQMKVGDKRD